MGDPSKEWNAAGDRNRDPRRVRVSYHHPAAFNLPPQKLESLLSRGIWIFVGIQDFSLGSSVPGVRSQVYQLTSRNRTVHLVEHYRFDGSDMTFTIVVAKYLNGNWNWMKNEDPFLRRGNLRGIRLRCITGPEYYQKIHTKDSRGKMIGLKSGYIGDIWNVIEMVLNFTCNWKEESESWGGYCYLENNTCSGHMNYLATEEGDVAVDSYSMTGNRDVILRASLPIMESTLCLYGKARGEVPWWQVFFAPFDLTLWFGTLGLLLLCIFVGIFTSPARFQDTAFFVVAIFLNQSPSITLRSLARPMIFLLAITFYIIWACFSAALASCFASRSLFPFSSASEFADSRWLLAVDNSAYDALENEDLKKIFEKKNKPEYLRGIDSIDAVMAGSTAYLGESLYFEKSVADYFTKNQDVCRIKKIFAFPVIRRRGMVYAKDFPYARMFDLTLLKIQEAGIMHYIGTKWYPSLDSYCATDEAPLPESIPLETILLPHILLGSGAILSLALIIFEAFRKMKSRKKQWRFQLSTPANGVDRKRRSKSENLSFRRSKILRRQFSDSPTNQHF